MTEQISENMSGNKKLDYKLIILGVILVLAFLILAGRLYYLQIVNDENFATLSEQNRIRIISQPAKRGDIYDCNMDELATSKPVFTISLASSEIDDKENLAKNLAAVLGDPEITTASILEQIKSNSRIYEPIIIKRIPYDEGLPIITRLEEMRNQLPGVLISEEPMRYYPQGDLAGHTIGTVGLLSKEEEELKDKYGYQNNDWLGKSGLEKTMERFTVDDQEIGLRGQKGIEKVEVNSRHRPVRTISSQDPVSGNSLVLTLDSKVQKVLEESLQETIARVSKTYPKCRGGAAVLLNVKTGGVIAMASYPKLNPNDFANGLSRDKVPYYMENESRPMFNRAVSGAYPSGSTFKAATAVAIMASQTISPYERITCSPSAWKKPRAKCPRVHGSVDLSRALALSCN
ncbi:MAG: penicillin-binding transpeptidase domain-containing protein, partial [Clostridiales bacterium]